MSTRLLSASLAATLAASLALSLPAGIAFAQTYAPPAGIPTAAAIGASASPLIGQGYLPSPAGRDDGISTGSLRMEHRLGGRDRVR